MNLVAHRPSEWERLKRRKVAISRQSAELCRDIAALEEHLAQIDGGHVRVMRDTDREFMAQKIGRLMAQRLGLKNELDMVESKITAIERVVEERKQVTVEQGPVAEGQELTDIVSAIKEGLA